MFMEKSLDEITMKLALKIYQKYVIISSKEKLLLYVQILKTLYGLLRSLILFHRNLVKVLEACRFQINPYYPLVENNMVNDKHMTLVCQVENLKLSCVKSFEITKFIGYLSSIYGGPTIHRKKVKDSWVMDLDYIN